MILTPILGVSSPAMASPAKQVLTLIPTPTLTQFTPNVCPV